MPHLLLAQNVLTLPYWYEPFILKKLTAYITLKVDKADNVFLEEINKITQGKSHAVQNVLSGH